MERTPRQAGQSLLEYALILVLVALIAVVAMTILGHALGNVFSKIVSSLAV